MNKYNKATQLWAEQIGLAKADPSAQILKIYEEVSEMTQAYTRDQQEGLKMELGDVYVTLAVFALQVGIEPADAIKTAYNKIAERDGKLVNGTFIKQEDLKELEE